MTKKTAFSKSVTFSFSESIQYASGAIVSKVILKQPKGNVTLFAFDQGEGLSEHSTPFDALVQIVDGTAEITIDKISHVLNSGQAIILPANVPHAVFAQQKFKMVLTMIRS